MRILLGNKFFYPRAGAESVFFQSRELLLGRGHEVVDFAMEDPQNLPSPDSAYFAPARSYSAGQDARRRAQNAAASVYSLAARRSLRRLVKERRPDVAHLHNIYHQLTTSVIDELRHHQIPVVLTLHDYKIVCPSYYLSVNDAPCRRCVGHLPWHVVRHRCIKGSVGGSAVAAIEALLTRMRRSYAKADAIVTPSRFLAELASTYVPAERIHVLPNFLNEISALDRAGPRGSDRPYVLFAGRLETGKGVELLFKALETWDQRVELRLAGAGPLQAEVEQLHNSGKATYVGVLPRNKIDELMRNALAVVVPSLWEENYPMSVVEARAAGTVPICSARGGMREMVDDGVDGFIFDPSNPRQLVDAVTRLVDDPDLQNSMANRSHARARRENSADAHYDALMAVYRAAQVRRSRPRLRPAPTASK